MGFEAQLTGQLQKQDDLTPNKLGQTDIVFGLWSEFISRSVHASLQVSTCSSYDLCHRG